VPDFVSEPFGVHWSETVSINLFLKVEEGDENTNLDNFGVWSQLN
jgi:hypothetical protein